MPEAVIEVTAVFLVAVTLCTIPVAPEVAPETTSPVVSIICYVYDFNLFFILQVLSLKLKFDVVTL